MPKFVCSYAYDVPAYADFTVEAKSQLAAQRKINKALREGKLKLVTGEISFENAGHDERVFIQGEATDDAPSTTLDDIIADPANF